MAEEGFAEDQQITFVVKSSSDRKHTISVSSNTTVADLKTKLSSSEYADIPAARQRLIYSGRVLKDTETLASYKVKDGHTIHLVKGADSNARQNPADQGGRATGASQANPTANVPQNIAAGTGANNPLAGLTGARYAGFGQLPGMDMFGADGGMGAPPDPDQLMRLMEDPNFAQQMNEAMNNPAVLDMMRNSPMMRNNPMAQQVLSNPELRRIMFNPEFMRAQMNLQRQMGGAAFGGNPAFPAPGQTDTTQNQTAGQRDGQGGAGATAGANPFAGLFGPGAGLQGTTPAASPPVGSTGQGAPAATSPGTEGGQNQQAQQDPFANLMGLLGSQGNQGAQGTNDPLADMTRTVMQNPEMMRSLMGMMGGQGGAGAGAGAGAQPGANPFGFNPFMFGGPFGAAQGQGQGQQQQGSAQPADNRPPEEMYADQLRQLNDMGFFEFDRNVRALRMCGGRVEGAVEMLLSGTV